MTSIRKESLKMNNLNINSDPTMINTIDPTTTTSTQNQDSSLTLFKNIDDESQYRSKERRKSKLFSKLSKSKLQNENENNSSNYFKSLLY
jgi:hypothetical protein